MQEVQRAQIRGLPQDVHAALGVRDGTQAEEKEKAGLRCNADRPGDPGMRDHKTSSDNIAQGGGKVKMTRDEIIRSAQICKNSTTCAGCVYEKENLDFNCIRELLFRTVELLKAEGEDDE